MLEQNKLWLNVKGYYSASIRGQRGEQAKDSDIDANIQRALQRSSLIAGLMDLYVPHKYESGMRQAWRSGAMTIEKIIDMDLFIVRRSDIVICDTNPALSSGVRMEVLHAVDNHIPVIETYNISVGALRQYIYTTLARMFRDDTKGGASGKV